jgi:hypothetical protein
MTAYGLGHYGIGLYGIAVRERFNDSNRRAGRG